VKKYVVIVSLILMVALSRCFAADASSDSPQSSDDKVVDAKANELLAGKTTRLDKISALHTFARDEIGQAKTQYG
jgi:hypothetical protein